MRIFATIVVVLALAGADCSNEHGMKPTAHAQVRLAPTADNNAAGLLELIAVGDGVHMQGEITGLAPDTIHGFHIHEKGDCSAPDGSSAGGHFNPQGVAHGNPSAMPHHAGDIPNQHADAQGVARIDVVVHGVSLGSSAADDILGRSLIVHRNPDDYRSQPSGNSGPRVACGVIR